MKKPFVRIILMVAIVSLLFGACRKDPAPQPQPTDSSTEKPVSLLVDILDSVSYAPEDFMLAICESPMFKYMDRLSGGSIGPVKGLFRMVGQVHIPEMDSLFDARMGRSADGTRQWQVYTYSFSYKSTTAAGEPVVLSARISFPSTISGAAHQLSTITLFGHQMVFANSWAPSQSLSMPDGRVFYNSAVISPDFQGLGIDIFALENRSK